MTVEGSVNRAFVSDQGVKQGQYYDSTNDTSADYHQKEIDRSEEGDKNKKVKHLRRTWVAMALFLLCYQTAFMATIPVTTQYLSKRIGEDKFNFTNFTHSIPCTRSNNGSDSETTYKVQKEVSALSLLINYASSLPAIFTCLPYGTLSDHVGRKKILFFPLFGALGRTLMYVFVVKFRMPLNYLYIGSAIDGLCGSYHATSMITASIVADVTTSASSRAISFAIIECILIASSSLSNLTVGYLIAWDGFFIPVVMMAALVAISIVIVFLLLPESLVIVANKKPSRNPCTHLKRIVSFYLFEGTRIRKVLFQMGMFMFFFNILISLGRSTIETLYQLNSPFCWESDKIGDFSAIQSFVQILCSVVALKVLRTCLSLETIGMLALTGAIGGFVLEGFAQYDWMLYIVPGIGLILYTITPITRALLSKMAGPSEQGALFASLSVVDATCGILSFTLYSTIYIHTLELYRGTVFFVMAGVCGLNFLLFAGFKQLSAGHQKNEGSLDVETVVSDNNTKSSDEDKRLRAFVASNSVDESDSSKRDTYSNRYSDPS